jgi:hypothetical protein
MFVPWLTGSGEAVFMIATSASVAAAIYTFVWAVLLEQIGSVAAEQGILIFAVFKIIVGDAGVPGETP